MTTTEYTEYTETVRNGVDTATLFATLDAIKAQPEIAAFRFRARTDGSTGPTTGARSRTSTRPAARTPPAPRLRARRRRAGDPAGHRHRPQPGRVPAARARRLRHHVAGLRRGSPRGAADEVESTLEGDLDVRGAWAWIRQLPQRFHARSGWRSPSPVTPRRRSSARSSSAGPTDPSSSTASPTGPDLRRRRSPSDTMRGGGSQVRPAPCTVETDRPSGYPRGYVRRRPRLAPAASGSHHGDADGRARGYGAAARPRPPRARHALQPRAHAGRSAPAGAAGVCFDEIVAPARP